MKEIIRIHIAKTPYDIELDAKRVIEKYLRDIEHYADSEVLEDIEIRVTELLADKGIGANDIITKASVEEIMAQLVKRYQVSKEVAGQDIEDFQERIVGPPCGRYDIQPHTVTKAFRQVFDLRPTQREGDLSGERLQHGVGEGRVPGVQDAETPGSIEPRHARREAVQRHQQRIQPRRFLIALLLHRHGIERHHVVLIQHDRSFD